MWCVHCPMPLPLTLYHIAGDAALPRRVLPFGDGIKNCVGQAYGQMLVRTGLALLLVRKGWRRGVSTFQQGVGCRSMS
jgi:cytochrome P450